jgi:cell division protein FtsW
MGAQTSVKQKFSIRDLFIGLDIPLLLTIIALLILGLVVLYSASMPVGIQYGYHPIEDVLEQGRWALLGLFIAFFISLIDYRKLQPVIFYLLALAIFALVLVLLVGEERFGATRTFFNGRIHSLSCILVKNQR